MAILGVLNFRRLPIDAVPDITNVQVQVNTAVEALSPLEIEKQITFPIETAMAGLPGVEQIRSLSRYGLSQVTVIFKDGTDIYFARQLMNERLQEARDNLPPGLGDPEMGPIATGLGEVFFWAMEADSAARKEDGTPYSAIDLRTLQDWVVKPQLRTVPGVTEVNSIGGYAKQFHVTPDPAKLVAHGLTFRDVFESLASNNANAGGGYIEHRGEQYLIRSTGLVSGADEIRDIVLGTTGGVPVRVRDVAEVVLGKELRTGAATRDGEETVIGTTIMLMGENSRARRQAGRRQDGGGEPHPSGRRAGGHHLRSDDARRCHARDRAQEPDRGGAPRHRHPLRPARESARGADRGGGDPALHAVRHHRHGRAGGERQPHEPRRHRLRDHRRRRGGDGGERAAPPRHPATPLGKAAHRIGAPCRDPDAAREVARPVLFGVAIIMIVYLPILTLTGVEGKMFRPMAQVVLLALGGALILALTFIPAMLGLLLRGKVAEHENWIMRAAASLYRPTLRTALRWRGAVVAGALVLLAGCGLLATRLGNEFVPQLLEGDLMVQAIRIPSASLTTSIEMQEQLERFIRERFPDEVETVFARIGTAEIATDPMGPNVADTNVMLKPRAGWKRARTSGGARQRSGGGRRRAARAELRDHAADRAALQRAHLRRAERPRREGVRRRPRGHAGAGRRIAAILASIPGSADVKVEQVSGLPVLTIAIDRGAIARYGLNVADVHAVVETAVGGSTVGQVFEGDRRFDLVVRLPDEIRRDIHALADLPIPLPRTRMEVAGPPSVSRPRVEEIAHHAYVPLGAVARVAIEEGPNQIGREDGKRRVVAQANVRGRDLGGFVAEAERRIAAEVKLPAGYWTTWGGQFENLIAARRRLMVVVPVALVLILLLLLTSFGSIKKALLVFTGVPLALTGGIIALLVRGIPFSISAGVGFIALSGVAVLNGLVMLSFIEKLRAEGVPLETAILRGAETRLRPVLMTALVASLGFVPMAIAHGTGAEVQRPLATVVIGGIVSSTLLTLVVLPALYRLVHRPESEEPAPAAP